MKHKKETRWDKFEVDRILLKLVFEKIQCEGVNRIQLPQDKVQWATFVKTVGSLKARKYLSVNFCRKACGFSESKEILIGKLL